MSDITDDLRRQGYTETPTGFWIKNDLVHKLVGDKLVPVEGDGLAKFQEKVDKKESVIDHIKSIVGSDVLEIFGDTGTGKSRVALHIALRAKAEGKRVFYLDTERNLSDADVKLLGSSYKYTPAFDELMSIMRPDRIPKADLVILDSIGFPVLTEFARLNLRSRGQALLGMIAILGGLKRYCYENDALAIVTNQPQSELGLAEDEVRRPFGQKAAYAAKEIWETFLQRDKKASKVTIKSFRSRNVGYGTLIATAVISDKGVEMKWQI